MNKIKYGRLLFSILVCQLAGVIGSFFTVKSIEVWYEGLVKPAFSPPNWIFGPVWITLYTLMGISLYLVSEAKKDKKSNKFAIKVFYFHLVLNSLWSIIFFGLKNPGVAFVEIVILLVSIIYTTILFRRINIVAAYLLIPYIIWVSFAALLNFSIWLIN